MKRQAEFHPEWVISLFEEKDLRASTSLINTGWCMQWAYMAWLMFEDVELFSVPGHAFIRYHGKYYDSERLNGVDHWLDLPTNQWMGLGLGEIYPLPPDEFRARWNPWGKCYDFSSHWKYWEFLVENFCR